MMSEHPEVAALHRHTGEEIARENLQKERSFEFVRAGRCSATVVGQVHDFLDSQENAHPFQLPVWADEKGYLALYREDKKLLWFAQCGVYYPASRALHSVRALSVNRGPVCDDLEMLEAQLGNLVETAHKERFCSIEITPDWTGPFAEHAAARLPQYGWHSSNVARFSLRLDLKPDMDQLMSNFRKATRYEIRRSERLKIETTMVQTEAGIRRWLRLYHEMANKKRFPEENIRHVRRVLTWLQSNAGRGGLLLAYEGSKLIGGVVLVRCGKRCWYVWGATSKEQRTSAGHLLQWRAIQWAKQAGCYEYDFGGYTEGAKSGSAFFKSGFGGNVIRFLPSYRYIVRPDRQRFTEVIGWLRKSWSSLNKPPTGA